MKQFRFLVFLVIWSISTLGIMAQDIEITGFSSDGIITWTNAVPGKDYGIVWAPSLEGPWSCDWECPGMVTATGSTMRTQAPLFYRVVRWPMDGIVAYYPFTMDYNDKSTNEIASTPVSVTQVVDRKGTGFAASFDGTNSYIDCGDHVPLDCSNGVTITAWVKTASTNSASAIAGKFDGYYLAVNSKSISFNINNSSYAAADFPQISNEWFFVAGTWKSMETKTYVNGVQLGSSGIPWSMNTGFSYNFFMGCRFFSSALNWPFNGCIDELRVYNRALSPSEVWALYHYPR